MNNYQQQGGMGGFNKPKPPIPFNSGASLAETIAGGQKFVGSSKKIMDKMKAEHMKSV